MGPVAYACSLRGGFTADVGLIAYGLVEMGCAALVTFSSGGGNADIAALPNAVAVQLVIMACWFSLNKSSDSGRSTSS